jgi:hypothetical protein
LGSFASGFISTNEVYRFRVPRDRGRILLLNCRTQSPTGRSVTPPGRQRQLEHGQRQ